MQVRSRGGGTLVFSCRFVLHFRNMTTYSRAFPPRASMIPGRAPGAVPDGDAASGYPSHGYASLAVRGSRWLSERTETLRGDPATPGSSGGGGTDLFLLPPSWLQRKTRHPRDRYPLGVASPSGARFRNGACLRAHDDFRLDGSMTPIRSRIEATPGRHRKPTGSENPPRHGPVRVRAPRQALSDQRGKGAMDDAHGRASVGGRQDAGADEAPPACRGGSRCPDRRSGQKRQLDTGPAETAAALVQRWTRRTGAARGHPWPRRSRSS